MRVHGILSGFTPDARSFFTRPFQWNQAFRGNFLRSWRVTWGYHGLRAASDVLVTKGQFMSLRGGKRRTRLRGRSRWVTMLAVGAVLVGSSTAWADVTSGHRRYASAPELPQSPSVGHVTSLPSHFVKP